MSKVKRFRATVDGDEGTLHIDVETEDLSAFRERVLQAVTEIQKFVGSPERAATKRGQGGSEARVTGTPAPVSSQSSANVSADIRKGSDHAK